MGFSLLDNDLYSDQLPEAFDKGGYAIANLLYHPVPNVMMGGELQYGKRYNHSDGFTSDDVKFQFSFKYSFGKTFGI